MPEARVPYAQMALKDLFTGYDSKEYTKSGRKTSNSEEPYLHDTRRALFSLSGSSGTSHG